jgi:hypothetical protein
VVYNNIYGTFMVTFRIINVWSLDVDSRILYFIFRMAKVGNFGANLWAALYYLLHAWLRCANL